MHKSFRFFLIIILIVFTWVACSKSSSPPANPCAGVTITVTGTSTNATTGQSNGSIIASATGSTAITYNINTGAFQSSGTFSNLAAGTYTITARNADGCTGTQQLTVATTNACSGTITASAVATTAVPCGGAGGNITITASGSTGLTYSLSGGAFQSSNIFSNQSAGAFVVTVKDVNGCTQTANVTVAAAPAGNQFAGVKAIVQNSCAISGCHNVTTQAGGINFQIDCNIVANAARIKVRAVDQAGTPSQMPQTPNAALSATQQQQITTWITGGGKFDN